MRDRDKLRRVKRANEVQAETLDEYRNTIKFLELKLLRLENEIEKAKEMEEQQIKNVVISTFKAVDGYCFGMTAEEYYEEYFKLFWNDRRRIL